MLKAKSGISHFIHYIYQYKMKIDSNQTKMGHKCTVKNCVDFIISYKM